MIGRNHGELGRSVKRRSLPWLQKIRSTVHSVRMKWCQSILMRSDEFGEVSDMHAQRLLVC